VRRQNPVSPRWKKLCDPSEGTRSRIELWSPQLSVPGERNASLSLFRLQRKEVKEQWGKLTDDDLDVIAGKRDQLEGKLQERYGYAKDRAQKEMNDWYGRQTW
jgi:uncharacterized protein YjbJ (UPF0337 family)